MLALYIRPGRVVEHFSFHILRRLHKVITASKSTSLNYSSLLHLNLKSRQLTFHPYFFVQLLSHNPHIMSEHTAQSHHTAKLSIARNATGKLICNLTDYPGKDGEPSGSERSWNTLKEVADGTRNTFGRADTVGEILKREEARAFGWSPSENGEEAIIGGSFWEGARKCLLL